MRLNGKVAWVVGGSSGIGAAVARELVCRGATVAISARRKEQLHDVAGGDMLVLPADVTDAASVSAAAARVRQELGPIDLAVLSAGYWKPIDPSDWRRSAASRPTPGPPGMAVCASHGGSLRLRPTRWSGRRCM